MYKYAIMLFCNFIFMIICKLFLHGLKLSWKEISDHSPEEICLHLQGGPQDVNQAGVVGNQCLVLLLNCLVVVILSFTFTAAVKVVKMIPTSLFLPGVSVGGLLGIIPL